MEFREGLPPPWHPCLDDVTTNRHGEKTAMTYDDLEAARRVLGTSQHATLAEIKAQHRRLVKLCHPDVAGSTDPERIRSVNAAYRLLVDYCAGYRFDFSRSAYYDQFPEERLREQFADDPIWKGR